MSDIFYISLDGALGCEEETDDEDLEIDVVGLSENPDPFLRLE